MVPAWLDLSCAVLGEVGGHRGLSDADPSAIVLPNCWIKHLFKKPRKCASSNRWLCFHLNPGRRAITSSHITYLGHMAQDATASNETLTVYSHRMSFLEFDLSMFDFERYQFEPFYIWKGLEAFPVLSCSLFTSTKRLLHSVIIAACGIRQMLKGISSCRQRSYHQWVSVAVWIMLSPWAVKFRRAIGTSCWRIVENAGLRLSFNKRIFRLNFNRSRQPFCATYFADSYELA
jgi:hypothetical protein